MCSYTISTMIKIASGEYLSLSDAIANYTRHLGFSGLGVVKESKCVMGDRVLLSTIIIIGGDNENEEKIADYTSSKIADFLSLHTHLSFKIDTITVIKGQL